MNKVRVLIVDDSVVIRRLLKEILSEDPNIEVVGSAANGRIALAKLPQLNPDLVTLDIEMPEMDGLATLRELRQQYAKLPVIMFSTLTERGALATIDALALGASDYVTKPANVGSVTEAMKRVKEQLIPKIKSLCPGSEIQPRVNRPATMSDAAKPPAAKPKTLFRTDIVVVGSSTGGPQALAALLEPLPAGFPVPIVVVQHMPPVFTKHLADRLNQTCALDVIEAEGGERVTAGSVVIAPGDFHLELQRKQTDVVTAIHQGPKENSCRPAVDPLFRSAAKLFGPNCLGVVLTGMGQDGLLGSESIVHSGGAVIAQDEASSVVWGMPRAVSVAGLAHQNIPIQSMARYLIQQTAFLRRQTILA